MQFLHFTLQTYYLLSKYFIHLQILLGKIYKIKDYNTELN